MRLIGSRFGVQSTGGSFQGFLANSFLRVQVTCMPQRCLWIIKDRHLALILHLLNLSVQLFVLGHRNIRVYACCSNNVLLTEILPHGFLLLRSASWWDKCTRVIHLIQCGSCAHRVLSLLSLRDMIFPSRALGANHSILLLRARPRLKVLQLAIPLLAMLSAAPGHGLWALVHLVERSMRCLSNEAFEHVFRTRGVTMPHLSDSLELLLTGVVWTQSCSICLLFPRCRSLLSPVPLIAWFQAMNILRQMITGTHILTVSE